jgi:hypothetical protein
MFVHDYNIASNYQRTNTSTNRFRIVSLVFFLHIS